MGTHYRDCGCMIGKDISSSIKSQHSKSLRKAHGRGDKRTGHTMRFLVISRGQRQYFATYIRYYCFIFCQSEGSLLL